MNYYNRAKELAEETVAHRRYMHKNAEAGLDLPKTKAYVMEQLRECGIEPQDCGYGVTATLGSFNTFVAWTPNNNAQFLCLEPMYSFGDASRPCEMSQMYGITKLEKGKTATYTSEFRFS